MMLNGYPLYSRNRGDSPKVPINPDHNTRAVPRVSKFQSKVFTFIFFFFLVH